MSFDWGSLAGAAVSLYSANRNASAASAAGRDANRAAKQANDIDWRMYQDQRNLNMPFYNTGIAAMGRYAQLLGLPSFGGASAGATPTYVSIGRDGVPAPVQSLYDSNPEYRNAWDSVLNNHRNQWRVGYHSGSDRDWIQSEIAARMPQQQGQQQAGMSQQEAFEAFRNTPGYQFALDEGRRQIEAGAAARGGLYSGATMRALQRYGSGVADQQYGDYMNRLSGLFGGAQTAASGISAAGANLAGNVGNNLMNAANARAQSTYQRNQAWNEGLSNAAGFFGRWYGNRSGGGG